MDPELEARLVAIEHIACLAMGLAITDDEDLDAMEDGAIDPPPDAVYGPATLKHLARLVGPARQMRHHHPR